MAIWGDIAPNEWSTVFEAKPRLLRTVSKSGIPDTDWVGTQTIPPAEICADATGYRKIKVSYVAYGVGNVIVPSAGTCTLIHVKVMPLADGLGTIIKGSTAVPNVPVGLDTLGWNVIDTSIFTVRVSAHAFVADVTRINIFWVPSDF